MGSRELTAVARDLAENMLLWLAREPGRMAAFLEATGFRPEDLRAALQDVTQAAAVHLAAMDYIAADEALLLQFCADMEISPEHAGRVWRATAGLD